MSSTKHTPEVLTIPSVAQRAMIAECIPEDTAGELAPAYFNIADHIAAGTVFGDTQAEADARRDNIVACVNAMQGIEDPAAFRKCFDDLTAAMDLMLSDYRTEGCPDKQCLLCQKSRSAIDAACAALITAKSLTKRGA